MKNFCAIICEFNPFHNGHEYIIRTAKELSGCDNVIVIMSGSFTQRADICVADKFTRAKHAVLGGADLVLELPVSFSVAPAEIFARGAVKTLSSVPAVKTIAFGCESGGAEDFTGCAEILANETDDFKKYFSECVGAGESYIKALSDAVKKVGGDSEILSSPNNILGLEYTKSVLKSGKNIKILPIKRIGAGFNDRTLAQSYSSASAIRANLKDKNVKNNVPDYVYRDLNNFFSDTDLYEKILKISLSRENHENLRKVFGCTEGLENKLKSLEALPFNEIVEKTCSRRYTASRIKRILLASYLRLYADDCRQFLESDLYLKPLAVKKDCAEEILAELAASSYPVITCGSDNQKLGEVAKKCKSLDDFASAQWQQITDIYYKEKLQKV